MGETLADRYGKPDNNPIDVDGVQTVPMFTIDLQPNTVINVKRISNKEQPVQGLHVKTDKAALEIIGQIKKDLVLWADNSRAELSIRLTGRKSRTVKFWNTWINGTFIDAWQGNFGIQVDQIQGGVRLKCSDGLGEPDFTDLVIEVTFDEPADAPPRSNDPPFETAANPD